MRRIVTNAFSAFSPESFPAFSAVCGGLVLHASDLATPGGTTRQLRYGVHT